MGEISLTGSESFAASRWMDLCARAFAELFSLIARLMDLGKLRPYGTPKPARFVRYLLRGSSRLVWCPA